MYPLDNKSNIAIVIEQHSSEMRESKSRKNTRQHAIYDLKNAEESLKRADKAEDKDDINRYCIDSTKNSVDSVEKNGKAIAESLGIDKEKTPNGQELRRSHNISHINSAIKKAGGQFIDDKEANYLDSFASHENGCCSTHSELSYGGVIPDLSDAKKALLIAKKADSKAYDRDNEDEIENLIRFIEKSN